MGCPRQPENCDTLRMFSGSCGPPVSLSCKSRDVALRQDILHALAQHDHRQAQCKEGTASRAGGRANVSVDV